MCYDVTVKQKYVRVNISLPAEVYSVLRKRAYDAQLQPGTLAKQFVMAGVAK